MTPSLKMLLVGSGAREHALALKLAMSNQVSAIWVAPGNAGMLWGTPPEKLKRISDVNHINGWIQLAKHYQVDLVVIGPEAPLSEGLVDALEAHNIRAFGPSKAAAQLEASKIFAKQIMLEAGVPTARYVTVDTAAQAEEALNLFEAPYVIKADGLAAGKGVTVTSDRALAIDAIQDALAQGHPQVLVEQHLTGEELSVMAICDGERAVLLPPAQDYKRLLDEDKGPNTGGMGAVCPVPWVNRALLQRVLDTVILPVLQQMQKRGTPYKGVLYAGLMIESPATASPKINIIEFNCRFGDPETQVILAMLAHDLAPIVMGSATGDLEPLLQTLNQDPLALALPQETSSAAAVTVVIASEGYPANPQSGDVITLPGDTQTSRQSTILAAGVAQSAEKTHYITAGGRVLNVVGAGANLKAARDHAYQTLSRITFKGAHYRHDIGEKQLNALTATQQPPCHV
ncbi:MAG: phosphoribosylamine--glycine ligase [Vampirovibrionales bacterium]|nr:phosphoribosylamine--glycine ligase [Vampirovibrionales bacterium]